MQLCLATIVYFWVLRWHQVTNFSLSSFTLLVNSTIIYITQIDHFTIWQVDWVWVYHTIQGQQYLPPLGSSVLEPGLHLGVRHLQILGQGRAFSWGQVLLLVEALFELTYLEKSRYSYFTAFTKISFKIGIKINQKLNTV